MLFRLTSNQSGKYPPFALLTALVFSFATPVWSADVELHGFMLGTASSRLSAQPLTAGVNAGDTYNYLLLEQRLRLDVSGYSDSGVTNLKAKMDVQNDSLTSTTNLDVRELYGEYLSDTFEVRAGRQILTWGVADRLFINDVFPKNWSAFFAGQPLEYMKMGSDMAKLFLLGSTWDAELVVAPSMRADVTPGTDRFVVYSMPGVTVQEPNNTLTNAEMAMRFHQRFSDWDVALYASKGFWHQPDKGMNAAQTQIIYPRLNTYGATAQNTVLGGVLSLEGGFYQSADDTAGTNALIANSQSRWLLGYEHDVMSDVTMAVQLYGEIMHNHAAYLTSAQAAFNAGQGPKPLPQHRKIMTVNLRSLWLNQTLTASMFAMGVADGGGKMLNPDVSYAVTDEFSVNVGAHVFSQGPDGWMLGMMKHDDNAYVNAKWTF